MSRRPSSKPYGGPKLPFELQQKFALHNGKTKDRKPRTEVGDRKERRRAMRVDNRRGGKQFNGIRERRHESFEEDGSNPNQASEDELMSSHPEPQHAPKPILKRTRLPQRVELPSLSSDEENDNSRESSPGLVLDASSRTFKQRMSQDAAEIKTLEKRLGIKKGKKRKASDDDLDDILEGLGDDSELEDTMKEEKEWLRSKRRKSEAYTNVKPEDSVNSDDLDSGSGEENIEVDDLESESRTSGDQDSLDEEGSDNHEFEDEDDVDDLDGIDVSKASKHVRIPKVRENPYVPPVNPGPIGAKYIPPSLRKPLEGDVQQLEKLRKQVQGQLNKLSEANMISILGEVEKLYQSNPRQDMTSVMIDLLLLAFSVRSALPNTFIILHAAFVAAVYKIMGVEFGAEMVAKLVEGFDKYRQNVENMGKESLNFISLLANLFTFNVVSSGIIYDHIRLLLADFSESNTELLLRVVRDCGPQLRSDDPTALKEIVQMMHNVSAEMTKKGKEPNVRTRVMMDTITDLKNNKIKQATNVAGITGEHLIRMRKALGSLNNRQLRGTEPLRISREDIASSDKKGKWWLVGASWKGKQPNNNGITQRDQSDERVADFPDLMPSQDPDPDDIDLATLSRHYKMNTSIRRSIFVALTSAQDIPDALSRLAKLRLTRKQEPEIARVLLRCCRAEQAYNPYYAVLAKTLLKEHSRRYRMSFLIAAWKFFETMGEKRDENEQLSSSDDADDRGYKENIELHEIVNTAKMYAHLVTSSSLHLSDVLKTVNIGFTKTKMTMWLELIHISILTSPGPTAKAKHKQSKREQHAEKQTYQIFAHVTKADPSMSKSLKYFLHKHVRRTDLVGNEDQKTWVKRRCRIAEMALDLEGNEDLDASNVLLENMDI